MGAVKNLNDVIDNKNVMYKMVEVIGNDNELCLLKGQLINPIRVEKKDKSGTYLVFKLKTIKQISDDIYMQRTNMYQIIVSEEKCHELGYEIFRENINNEVLCKIELNNNTRQINRDNPLCFNNTTYYLKDIVKIRDIKRR